VSRLVSGEFENNFISLSEYLETVEEAVAPVSEDAAVLLGGRQVVLLGSPGRARRAT
jgi:hypothetical protein